MTKAKVKSLRVTQVRSAIGLPKDQKATVRALGIRRMQDTVELPDTPQVRGMIGKIQHLLKVEDA